MINAIPARLKRREKFEINMNFQYLCRLLYGLCYGNTVQRPPDGFARHLLHNLCVVLPYIILWRNTMYVNFSGLVSLHALPTSEPLLPLYEAIVNSIQSIYQRVDKKRIRFNKRWFN